MDNNGEIGPSKLSKSTGSINKGLAADGIQILHNLQVDKKGRLISPAIQKPAFLFVFWESCGHCHRSFPQVAALARKVKEEHQENNASTKYRVYAADLEDKTNEAFYQAMNLVGVPWCATISSDGTIIPFKGNRVSECPVTEQKGNECISFWDALSKTK